VDLLSTGDGVLSLGTSTPSDCLAIISKSAKSFLTFSVNVCRCGAGLEMTGVDWIRFNGGGWNVSGKRCEPPVNP
jgi:hypothetical protein